LSPFIANETAQHNRAVPQYQNLVSFQDGDQIPTEEPTRVIYNQLLQTNLEAHETRSRVNGVPMWKWKLPEMQSEQRDRYRQLSLFMNQILLVV